MKSLLRYITFLLFAFSFSDLVASSYAALDKPELSILEAVALAKAHVKTNLDGGDQYYIQEATCAYHDKAQHRSWLIGFAQPGGAYYFVHVYMDKTVVGGVSKKRTEDAIP